MDLSLCKVWVVLALATCSCLAASLDALNNLDAPAPPRVPNQGQVFIPPRQRPIAMQVPVGEGVEQVGDESVQNPELNPAAMDDSDSEMDATSDGIPVPAPEDESESDSDNETSSVKRDKRLFFWKPYHYDYHHYDHYYPRYYNNRYQYRRSYPRYYRRPYYNNAPYFYFWKKW